ncbi:MAG: BLUF domain-containing protein [Proteobacteria bacterium]|nr:BLUF domain-containing protein [Pseudomonadota bacterium]
MLVRLLYASRAVDNTQPAVQAILDSARRHNQDSGVTGVLVYGGGVFMQAIEGGRQAVSDLYGTISRDPRHKDVALLHYEEIVERRFGSWTMGLVDVSRVNASVLLKYSERAVLDPYAVSGKVSMALLEELIATASILSHT